jgi:hypothetical protein
MQQVQQAYSIDPAFGEKLYAQLVASQNREQWEPYGDGLQRNTVTGEIKKTGAAEEGGGTWKPSDIGSLRDDYTKAAAVYDNASPTWTGMQDTFSRVANLKEGESSDTAGAADYALVIGLAKIMDPTSVVREGEVETVRKTGGATDRLISVLNDLVGGGSLSPAQRRGLMMEANTRMQSYYDQVKTKRDWVTEIATRHGVDPRDVVAPLGEYKVWTKPEEQQPPAPDTPQPDQPDTPAPDTPQPQPTEVPSIKPNDMDAYEALPDGAQYTVPGDVGADGKPTIYTKGRKARQVQ